MLRSNGNSGKIRESDLVSIPYCSIPPAEARSGSGHVPRLSHGCPGVVIPSREKQSDHENIFRRCCPCTSAVLVALSAFYQRSFSPPAANSTSSDCRSWKDGWLLDKGQAGQRADWVIMRCSSAATGTTLRTPVRGARTGTTLHRTRTTISGRGSPVTTSNFRSADAMARQAGRLQCGQPILSSFGKYTQGSDIAPSKSLKSAVGILMAKTHKNLIDRITDINNLRLAYKKTAKNKRYTFGYLEFKEYSEANLLLVQEELRDGAYNIGPYRQFLVHEPKPRLISALDFKDRLVQHALCNVITPIFENALLPNTFACRSGFGTHAGVAYIQAKLRKDNPKYFLKTDYKKFFPSIDREILHGFIERKISCQGALSIIRSIIPCEGKGLPIGSLTSQLFANYYGGHVDRIVHFKLGAKTWARYMDDIVILGNDIDALREHYQNIVYYSNDFLRLNVGKWQISPVSKGVNFLGYRIWGGHKLLRKSSVIRAKRKIKRYLDRKDQVSLDKFIAAWSGHAKWAESHNLLTWLEKEHGITCH